MSLNELLSTGVKPWANLTCNTLNTNQISNPLGNVNIVASNGNYVSLNGSNYPAGPYNLGLDSSNNIVQGGSIDGGPSGPSGPSGPNGLIGPNGPSGPNGVSGPSGPNGLIGPNGPSGPSGPNGGTGLSGASGPSGPDGTDGGTGPSGPSGPGAMISTGSFSPVLNFGGSSTGWTQANVGVYTVIGNVCYIVITLATTAVGSSTGNGTISGLPFTPASGISYNMPISYLNGYTSANNIFSCFAASAFTTNLQLQQYNVAVGGITAITNTGMSSSTQWRLEGFYFI